MAPVSDTALRSKLAQGLFFFEFQAQPEGRMTQEYDTTTERKTCAEESFAFQHRSS